MCAWSSGGWRLGGCAARCGLARLAGWGHARERAGDPGRGRDRLAAGSAPVAVLGLRGYACAAAGELLAAAGRWGGGDLGGPGGQRAGCGLPEDRSGAGLPGAQTVGGWLARFRARAGLVRGVFTVWLCALDADPPPLPPCGVGSGRARWRRLLRPRLRPGAAGLGWAACRPASWPVRVSTGRLLSPSWAPELYQRQSGLGVRRAGGPAGVIPEQDPFPSLLWRLSA